MIEYLNLTEFADHLGIARDTLAKYRLPPHDAVIGDRRGWLVSTIETWDEQRPGRGNWGAKGTPSADAPASEFVTMNAGKSGKSDIPMFKAPVSTSAKRQNAADYNWAGEDDLP